MIDGDQSLLTCPRVPVTLAPPAGVQLDDELCRARPVGHPQRVLRPVVHVLLLHPAEGQACRVPFNIFIYSTLNFIFKRGSVSGFKVCQSVSNSQAHSLTHSPKLKPYWLSHAFGTKFI